MPDPAPHPLLVMGVAGSGKSSLGALLAQRLGRRWLEGDDFHPAANRLKMARGEPLDEADRSVWLHALLQGLPAQGDGTAVGWVLGCSALRRRHRERLRAAAPGLRTVHLDIPLGVAQHRVARRTGHFYPACLVASQFEALEPPAGEANVLWLDAQTPLEDLCAQTLHWLRTPAAAPA